MEQILKFSDEKDFNLIRSSLEDLNLDEVFQEIHREGGKGNPVVVTALRTLFRAYSTGPDNHCDETLLKIYMKILDFVLEVELTSRMSIDIIGLLLMVTGKLSSEFLPLVSSKLIEAIQKPGLAQSRRIADLLPTVINALACRHTVKVDGVELTGQESKAEVVNHLCSVHWGPNTATTIASVFQEIPLTLSELQLVINKLMQTMSAMDIQEVPPLIYQLLRLSAQGLREQVIQLVIDYFNEQDEKLDGDDVDDNSISQCTSQTTSANSLLHVEGTVILHITFVAKEDKELGKEFVKLLKSCQHLPGYILTPFTLALALSLGKNTHHGEQILDLLKNAIIRNFREREKARESFWLREMLSKEKDISLAILTAVQNTKSGWDYVSQGFVQLGFMLMDTYGPKPFLGKSLDVVYDPNSSSPTQQACTLGVKILEGVFKISANIRPEVIEQLVIRIMTKSSAPIPHYINLLTNTIQSLPQFYLDSQHQIQNVIERLSFFPFHTAILILTALTPLIKISMSLKDSLMVVLRKALFHRNVEARKVAVASFLHVLKNFRIIGGLPLSQSSCYSSQLSLSQVQVDVHARYNSEANEALCLELLNVVRRCLKLQTDVREIFYKELPKVLVMNPHLANPIMGILVNQLELYYEKNEDVNPPVRLEICIQVQNDDPILTEPFASLMLSIQKCIISHVEHTESLMDLDHTSEVSNHNFTLLQNMMTDIVKRMTKTDLDDFELGKSAEFNSLNSIGTKNLLMASQLLQIYQILMEYCFMTVKDCIDSYQNVLIFYEEYKRLAGIVRGKACGVDKENKGSRGSKSLKSVQSPQSDHNLISLKCLSQILEKNFCESGPEETTALECLRNHADFLPFVVTLTNQHIQRLHKSAETKGVDKVFKHCCTVGKAYVAKVFPFSNAATQSSQARSTINTSCLEGLVNVVSYVQSLPPNYLMDCLACISRDKHGPSSQNQNDIILFNIERFQDATIKALSWPDKEQKLKDWLIPLLNAISLLSNHLSDEEHFKSIFEWGKSLCLQQSLSEVAVVKHLLGLCLKLAQQGKELPTLVYEISLDLHQLYGDIDEEVEISAGKKYSVISSKSGASVCLLMLNSIDKMLDEVDWLLAYLRSTCNASAKPNIKCALPPATRSLKESSTCSKLGHITTAFHELAQTKLPFGPCTDTTLKLLIKFYNSTTTFAKYYVTVYNLKVGIICHRFEKLIQLVGSSLTPQVYSMITSVLNTAQETADQADGTSKAKSGSSATKKPKTDREPKLIPSLIFAIEQYERYLLQLTRKSKVNLMQYVKLSTSRDFRINIASVRMASQHESQADEEESSSENEPENE